MVVAERNIEYEYIDCFSISTGKKVRVVKVQESEFQWTSKKGGYPTKQEVYLRKRQFLEQLEVEWAVHPKGKYEAAVQPIHILYLAHSYTLDWYDLIRLLFTIDQATPAWKPAVLGRSLFVT